MLPSWVATAVSLGLLFGMAPAIDELKLKFSDCPAPVRKTLQAEAAGAKIETVIRERDDENETIYWADAVIGDRTYAIGVLEDGTLSEMNLAVDDEDVPLERCPEAVRATFKGEAFGEKVENVSKDRKYGVLIFEAVVNHKGKSYEISVAEDGTLFEKVLVIEDEEVELATCPAAVQAALKKHANGGTIHDITRSSGLGKSTYEAGVEVKDKVYLIEVDETGLLISKSLEAGEE